MRLGRSFSLRCTGLGTRALTLGLDLAARGLCSGRLGKKRWLRSTSCGNFRHQNREVDAYGLEIGAVAELILGECFDASELNVNKSLALIAWHDGGGVEIDRRHDAREPPQTERSFEVSR